MRVILSNTKWLIVLLSFPIWVLFLPSCTKNYDDYGPQANEGSVVVPTANAVIVLNEGNFMFGNGSVSMLDGSTETVGQEVFKQANGYPIGDVPQSMLIHDSLGYIIVNNSAKIEVVSTEGFKSVNTITGFNSPRQMAIVKEKPLTAWVTDLYADKIWEVNLETGVLVGSIPSVGWNENIIIYNSNAFVLNKKDSVINVFDLNTKSLVNTYTLGNGIVDFVYTGADALLYLANEGIFIVDLNNPGNSSPVHNFNKTRSPLKMTYDMKNKYIYFLETDLFKYSNGVVEKMISPQKGSNFYGLAVKPSSSEVYLSDTKDYVQPGVLRRYNSTFDDSAFFDVGINPQFILFQ